MWVGIGFIGGYIIFFIVYGLYQMIRRTKEKKWRMSWKRMFEKLRWGGKNE